MRQRPIDLAIARSFNACGLPRLGQMVGRRRAKLLHPWRWGEGSCEEEVEDGGLGKVLTIVVARRGNVSIRAAEDCWA